MDRICIVGGLVPLLLIDRQAGAGEQDDQAHPGTNDLDVALEIALFDEQQYQEISTRLRQEGFGPGKNERGNPTPQTWALADLEITIDFLMPPLEETPKAGKVQALEGDFGALVTRGLELTSNERIEIELDGRTLKNEVAKRSIPVCGPGVFVLLKSLAFADRGEPKDAYDLVYMLRRWPGGVGDIVERLVAHAARDREIVEEALGKLAEDFRTSESLGPKRATEFDGAEGENLDATAADVHGYVDDFLRVCREQGLSAES
jgi:hypothetical protein